MRIEQQFPERVGYVKKSMKKSVYIYYDFAFIFFLYSFMNPFTDT